MSERVNRIVRQVIPMHDIRQYGAVGDGQASDRRALQAAADACRQAGGGTIYIGPGRYLCGQVRLYSHTHLHIDAGAVLLASTDPDQYAHTPAPDDGTAGGAHRPDPLAHPGNERVETLLVADGAQHITLSGGGVIDGQTPGDLGDRWGVSRRGIAFRTGIALFRACRQIAVRDLTIRHSDCWTLHLLRCENVVVQGVCILNNYRRLNSDGINPNSCRNVHISQCHIVCGDDCIALKSSQAVACENITVSHCTLETPCTAFKLGTESYGDFRDIHLSHCTMRNTSRAVGFYICDGATVERVGICDISYECMRDADPRQHVSHPIYMETSRRRPQSALGRIRDIQIRNVLAVTNGNVFIQGQPEQPIENLLLANWTLRVEEPLDFATRAVALHGLKVRDGERDALLINQSAFVALGCVRGLRVENLRVEISAADAARLRRSLVYGYGLEDGSIAGVRSSRYEQPVDTPAVQLDRCLAVTLEDPIQPQC